MSMIRVTGSQIATARALAGLTRDDLACRAGLSYHSIRAWERSSNSIPEATYSHWGLYHCGQWQKLEPFKDGGGAVSWRLNGSAISNPVAWSLPRRK